MNGIRLTLAHTQSMRVQILVPVLAMMIALVSILSSVTTNTFTEHTLKQERDRIQNAFDITGNALETMLTSLDTTTKALMLDRSISLYMTGMFSSDIERVYARIDVLEVIKNALMQNNALYGFVFLNADGRVFGAMPHRNLFCDDGSEGDALMPELRAEIYKTGSKSRWIGPISGVNLHGFAKADNADEQYIVGASRFWSTNFGTAYGMPIVSTQTLKSYITMAFDSKAGIYLATSDGNVLASMGDNGVGLPKETWGAVADKRTHGNEEIVIEETGERRYVCYHYLDALDWYLIREIPMEEYERAAAEIRSFVWKSALILLVVLCAIYFLWMHRFVRGFDDIKKAIIRMQGGELGIKIERRSRIREVEAIRQEFNIMNESIQQLMSQMQDMQRNKLELELRNMQTQLSPHMIFNSITAIRWMAVMVGAERVSDMLAELSQMLRPVFRDWKIEWTLKEELEHLLHYSRLLDLRYGNHFCMTCEVPDDMHEILLPRFTIQPLVENACEHGGFSGEKMNVSISGKMIDEMVILVVSDNGSGIEAERLESIRKSLDGDGETGGIGLANVYSRLRLCKGKNSRMQIDCPPEGGTRVTISWHIR